MAFETKVILDSISPAGARLTTITATYPRFIHSEILTHRDRARNSASSRAIPFPTMSERIDADPVIPLQWPGEQSGMQGGDEIPEYLRPLARAIWLRALADAQKHAKALHNIGLTAQNECMEQAYLDHDEARGLQAVDITDAAEAAIKVHKSIPNRIVEPWMWITVVMTATEWKNFFRLRCHPDAEIHFQKIAGMIRDALDASLPVERMHHLPFVIGYDENELDIAGFDLRQKYEISTARCARVSYLTHEQIRDPKKDVGLFERLVQGSGFGHFSPHEHPAGAHGNRFHRSGPFVGWDQFRKQFPLENEPG